MKYIVLLIMGLLLAGTIEAQDSLTERYNLHFQSTYIYQYKPAFSAPYSGPNSLSPYEEKQNSLTATLYFDTRLWKGAQIVIDPEVAGGSGLSGAFGLSANTNGETFRVGDPAPTLYLARGYFQQTISLNKTKDTIADGENQLAGIEHTHLLRFMIGKYALSDNFDNSQYAGSPRTQFMNWALMNNAAWDYAANLRGYTYSFTAMLNWDNMAYKLALATEPTVANGGDLNTDLSQEYSINAEVDRAYKIHNRDGHIRVLGYYNNAHMGNYKDALTTIDTSGRPDVINTRKYGRTKVGFGINFDQQVGNNAGIFARVGYNDGRNETWAFTECDRTVAIGFSTTGKKWRRTDDNLGIAVVVNGLSADHKNYLAAGGLGFQLGDGRLNYANESALELYYSFKPVSYGIWLTGDYQLVLNPGYNADRGPVNVFSFRLHVEL